MTDMMLIAVCAFAAVLVLSLTALRGWRDWIALRTRQVELARPEAAPTAGSRIEVADLKERIRKLEAIAAGVEL